MAGHDVTADPGAAGEIPVVELPALAGGVLTVAQVAALDAALSGAEGAGGLVIELAGNTAAPLDPAALMASRTLAALVGRVAGWPEPVVVVLRGDVTGPAAALALAARARVALDEASLAWPELQVALVPAAGAMPRLAILAGPGLALDLAGSGRRITAAEARSAGLVDALARDAGEARALALALVAAPPPRPVPDGAATFTTVQMARAQLERGRAVPIALERLIDCIEAAALLPETQAIAFAAEAEEDVLGDPVGRALRHSSRAEQALSPDLTTLGAEGALVVSSEGLEAAGAMRAAWVLAGRALVAEGLSPTAIDAAACAWGHAEGPMGTAPPPRADAVIATRLVAALLAEAGRLVDGGALSSSLQADALAIMATGFPRWRGGPVASSIAMGQGVLARKMDAWAQSDPVWALPDTLRHAILATGSWGEAPR